MRMHYNWLKKIGDLSGKTKEEIYALYDTALAVYPNWDQEETSISKIYGTKLVIGS